MTGRSVPQSRGRLIKLPARASSWEPDEILKRASIPASPAAARMNKERLKVLLVEDDPGDARLVEFALRMSMSPSFDVKHVDTLARAIEHVETEPDFDVVLLDLSLPDSSGLSTVSRMQQAAPRTPLVIMTGRDDPRFAAQALEAGAQDYLIKSDDPERTVGRAIRYAISRMASHLERQALLERIAQQQRNLLDEVSAARRMQFDLLPRAERIDERLGEVGLEVEAFFEPSSGIGGDLWGCLDCGGQRMSFYNFDFTGHGIGAALNVFRLHALIADHWDPLLKPGVMLKTLSAALRGLLGRGQFATMFLCTVDTAKGELEWASAGAPAPVLAVDGRFRFLEASGIPLGLARDPQYTEHSESFPPGSCLFLYSDAITDAPVTDDEMFGEQGLAGMMERVIGDTGMIRVDRLMDGFYAKVRTPIEDDLTAVCIRRMAVSSDDEAPAPRAGVAGLSLVVADGEAPSGLPEHCQALDIGLAAQAGDGLAVLAGAADQDTLRRGLAAPFSGFVELFGRGGISDIGTRCFDVARAGGMVLSLTTASTYALPVLEMVMPAVCKIAGLDDPELVELVEICLGEAISNAVIHGNLEAPAHLRVDAKGFRMFRDAIRDRLNDPALAGRRIEVCVLPGAGSCLTISVSDRGRGLDLGRHLGHQVETGAKSGRGIGLIGRICSAIGVEDGGRTLVMTFDGTCVGRQG